jgi:histidinol-phosphate aminotransferase
VASFLDEGSCAKTKQNTAADGRFAYDGLDRAIHEKARLGILTSLVAHPEALDRLRPLLPPYSVNAAALRALDAALDDRAYLTAYVAQAAASRAFVYDFCRRNGLPFWPSDANFVLVRIGPDAAAIAAALADKGILIRDKSAAPGCAGCVRITSGIVDHTLKALAALEDHLASRSR